MEFSPGMLANKREGHLTGDGKKMEKGRMKNHLSPFYVGAVGILGL